MNDDIVTMVEKLEDVEKERFFDLLDKFKIDRNNLFITRICSPEAEWDLLSFYDKETEVLLDFKLPQLFGFESPLETHISYILKTFIYKDILKTKKINRFIKHDEVNGWIEY